jgi:transposase-like protein
MRSRKSAAFKWRHFNGEVIMQCVRWFCKYGISYRDLEEMMEERGLELDHTTVYRWVQHYAPELKKRLDWLKKRLLKSNPTCDISVINTDKNPAYGQAIKELKQEATLDSQVKHLQIKYQNNRLEADHGKLKRLINPVRGFQSMKTAYATIKGFEIMRMFKKGQFDMWMYGTRTEVSLSMNNSAYTVKICPNLRFLTI